MAAAVPILGALAPGLDLHPLQLILPATFACSCGFMLPVATPPNAIVFATGLVTTRQMAHAGFCLNLIAIVLVSQISYWLVSGWLIV